jgi:hypothetical protein
VREGRGDCLILDFGFWIGTRGRNFLRQQMNADKRGHLNFGFWIEKKIGTRMPQIAQGAGRITRIRTPQRHSRESGTLFQNNELSRYVLENHDRNSRF